MWLWNWSIVRDSAFGGDKDDWRRTKGDGHRSIRILSSHLRYGNKKVTRGFIKVPVPIFARRVAEEACAAERKNCGSDGIDPAKRGKEHTQSRSLTVKPWEVEGRLDAEDAAVMAVRFVHARMGNGQR